MVMTKEDIKHKLDLEEIHRVYNEYLKATKDKPRNYTTTATGTGDTIVDRDYIDKAMKKSNINYNYGWICSRCGKVLAPDIKECTCKPEPKSNINNPFNSKFDIHESYHYIDNVNGVLQTCFDDREIDRDIINNANSFNDEDFANQVYLHELLNRKLLKYAWDNKAEDCEWDKDGENLHYYIYFDNTDGYFEIEADNYDRSQNTYFSKAEVARQAIKDVIEPFMKEHPEFVW